MVGTLLFGYGSPELPNDITMRSFFIPATVLVLAFFARFTHSATQQALAIGIPAALMGLPFLPWFDLVQSLPGLGLSRFTMSDFKVHMVLAVLLLASSGLRSLAALESPVPRRMLFGFAASGAFTVLMGVVGVRGPYSLGAWLPGLLTLVASLGAIAVYWLARRRAWTLPRAVELWPVLAGVLVLGTAASGLYWAFSNPVPWRTDRVAAEVQAYGSTVEDLLAQRVDYTGATQRPARIPPTDGYTLSDLRSVKGNRVYYTGEYSVGGYLNLKGSLTPEQLESALMDESTGTEFARFLAAPGLVLTGSDLSRPSGATLLACAEERDCGPADIRPVRYDPGHFAYEVRSDTAVEALLNESYYPGWEVRLCDGGSCTSLEPARSELGLLDLALPAGDYMLELDYRTPGRLAGWVSFGSGIVLAFAALVGASTGWARRKKATVKA
jgi:hypothetical protein